mgnify:CR=1 FL=1
MKTIQTEILVIGAGATGTGVLRDLAMRGFDTILVEKRDLTHGTTGRFHGLLHSGGRYAVKDPQAAQECIEENRILRRIMPHCIEDTGGFFVLTPWDQDSYADSFWRGCQAAGIPVEEVSLRHMLIEEPLLNPEISRCFRVPDAAADSFAAAHANVASAREYQARVFTYHEVTQLLTDNRTPNPQIAHPLSPLPGRIYGALCHDLIHDEPVTIYADLVINAAGAWAGKIAASAGIEIAMRPGKGTMIAVSQRVVNTVINRCKMPADGDILVPAHTVAVMGTTDEQVPDPDHFAIESWEVQRMLEEGEKILPGFSELRMLRAWAGVRPLYQETKTDQSRDITRSFVLLDHEQRDRTPGMLTITSGKWTTYRKMAQAAADLACQTLDTQRECRTHLEELPAEDGRSKTGTFHSPPPTTRHHFLGQRLAHIESHHAQGQLICECELATRADIEQAILTGEAKTLDDIRRDVRLGMGPCQGGFCTLRAAGILHQHLVSSNQHSVEKINVALHDFLEERWKGVVPVLWGKQLHQERLNELIYLNVLHIDSLPGPKSSRLAAQPYEDGERRTEDVKGHERRPANDGFIRSSVAGHPSDVIVIGAGLAGLMAGWQASSRGLKTRVITKGWGVTHWASGCIDVLGQLPDETKIPGQSLAACLPTLIAENSQHPYCLAGIEALAEALLALQSLCQQAGYPLNGSLEKNWLLPTAIGATRPTCLAPDTMIAGNLRTQEPMLLVGFEGHPDFYPGYAAANLQAQGFAARAITIPIPGSLQRQRIDTMTLARAFDKEEFRHQVIALLRPHLGNAGRIGFAAVLGLKDALGVTRELESGLGRRVFEIAGLPPSVPGMRLHHILVQAIRQAGGRVHDGIEVQSFETDPHIENRVAAMYSHSSARPIRHTAKNFILATGGILGGGIYTTPHDDVYETIFNLPVDVSPREEWLQRAFAHPAGHPIFGAGVGVDSTFHTLYANLFAVGELLGGADFVRQQSLEGVALVSAYQTVQHILVENTAK